MAPKESNSIDRDVLAAGRAACYKARDSFYACLERSEKTPTELATVGLLYPTDCKQSRVQFEKLCRKTWVKHFDRQYCAQRKLNRLLDRETRPGPIVLPQHGA